MAEQGPKGRGEGIGRKYPADGLNCDKTNRTEVNLEIDGPICDEAAICGLLDDWLVPMILDAILKNIGS
jgi:hypothetical protein